MEFREYLLSNVPKLPKGKKGALSNAKERARVASWITFLLSTEDAEEFDKFQRYDDPGWKQFEAAEDENHKRKSAVFEQLKQFRPDLQWSEFVRLITPEPKRKRGRPTHDETKRITFTRLAARDVQRVKRIMKKHFGFYSRDFAIEIAAKHWDESVDALHNHLKRPLKRR